MQAKTIILALDPGETTGYIVCSVERSFDTLTLIDNGVLSKWRGLDNLIDYHNPTVIVAEQYRLYPQAARMQAYSTIVAARVLGAIEYIAEQRNLKLVEQSASVGKQFISETVYHRLPKMHTRHERDALRHAVVYCFSIGVKE